MDPLDKPRVKPEYDEALRPADPSTDTSAGQRPPLSCRTSPPQGGRLAVTNAFANHPHPAVRAMCKSTNWIPFCAVRAHSDSASSSR
ncbi:MAG: hypothetical protein E5V74_18290 [Mesorhizobium sp.]|nr:MAG: hypothetical protein E5V74_18290 [Mesorhizobium sp.]